MASRLHMDGSVQTGTSKVESRGTTQSTFMPSTMNAVRVHGRGGPEFLKYEDASIPQLVPGDALVRVQRHRDRAIGTRVGRDVQEHGWLGSPSEDPRSRIFRSSADPVNRRHRCARGRRGRICGEFPDIGTAYYHPAVNYTTLGYGDLIMTSSWKLLGPMEASDGMLMFGVSTTIIFAVG